MARHNETPFSLFFEKNLVTIRLREWLGNGGDASMARLALSRQNMACLGYFCHGSVTLFMYKSSKTPSHEKNSSLHKFY